MTSGNKRRSVPNYGSWDSGYRKSRSSRSKRSRTGTSASGLGVNDGDRRRCTQSKQKVKLKKGEHSTEKYSDSSPDRQEIDEAAALQEVVAANDSNRGSTTTSNNGTTDTTTPHMVKKVTIKRKPGQELFKNGTKGKKKKKKIAKWLSVNKRKKNIVNVDGKDTAATASSATAATTSTSITTRRGRAIHRCTESKVDHKSDEDTTELLNSVNYGNGSNGDDGRFSRHSHNFECCGTSTEAVKETTNGIGLKSSDNNNNNTIPDQSLIGQIVKIYSDGEWNASRVIRAHIEKPFLYLLEPLSSSRKHAAKKWVSLNGSVTQFMFSSNTVWGRCKGYPAWPGIKYSFSRAATESKILKHSKPKNRFVVFFASNDSAWLPDNRISTFKPSPKQLDSPLDMLTKGQRKHKALVQAVKDAVKEMIKSRSVADASTVGELTTFTSRLSGPASWVGLYVRATKARKGADYGIVRAYSTTQRKWLIVWQGGDPLDPPPPPTWYGRHALQLAALPDEETNAPVPPLPGSGICRTCFVENVKDEITGLQLSVITCFKCKSAYHGCCLDPPIPNSVIALAASIQARQMLLPPPCDDCYFSGDDETERYEGEKKDEEPQQQLKKARNIKLEVNEGGRMNDYAENNSVDEDRGLTSSETVTTSIVKPSVDSSPSINGVHDQEEEQKVKCEVDKSEQQQPGTHFDGDSNNMQDEVEISSSTPQIGIDHEQQLILSDHESLPTSASGSEQVQTSIEEQQSMCPVNISNKTIPETDVQLMRKVEERETAIQAEKDMRKLRSLLPGTENGQWICDGCVVCHGCGISRRDDSSVRLHVKNPVFFCFKMDHGIEDDQDFTSFDIFGPPPPSHSMLCKACTLRVASGSFCPICEFTWKDEEEQCNLLGCDFCHFWVHAECEGFSSNEEFTLIQLGKHQVYGEGSRYACPVCRARMQIECLRSLINGDWHDFFALPVTSSVAPGYSKVIKAPMDLCTIEQKMARGMYCTMQAMRSDVELMVLNALTYNPRGSPVYEFVLSFYPCCVKAFDVMEIKTVPSPHGVVIRDNHIRSSKVPAALTVKAAPSDKKNNPNHQQSPPVAEEKKGNNSIVPFKNESLPDTKIDIEIAHLCTLAPIPDPMVLPGFQGPTLWLTKGEAFYLAWMDLCFSCGSAGSAENMLYCHDCGEAFHFWCVLAPGGSMDAEARAGWRCNNCKICCLCYEAKPNDDGVLLYCEVCDRAYHTDCLQPPLPSVPEGRWVCGRCVKCKDCSIPLSFREWSVTHEACKFCLRHCLRSHSAQDGVVWKRRQKLISILQSKQGREVIMSQASAWKTKPLETLANDQCPVCTYRWGGTHDLNQKPTALCECCGLYVHPQCDPGAAKLCAMISSGTQSPLLDFFCASCLGVDLMHAAQELVQLDKLLREGSFKNHVDLDDNQYEFKCEVTDIVCGDPFSNHLGSSEAIQGMAKKVGAIQRQRILLSSAFLSRFIHVASQKAETSLRVFNASKYQDVIHKARDVIEQLEQGKLGGQREGQHGGQICWFPAWKKSRAARFLRSYRLEKSNVKLRAALGLPARIVKERKTSGQDSNAAEEDYSSMKQELIVRQAMRAATFLEVVLAELDLPPLDDDFILMLSRRWPIDVTPSTLNNDIDNGMVIVDSDLESGGGVQAMCHQNDLTANNTMQEENIMDVVETTGNDYDSSGEETKQDQENSACGGEMVQSKDYGYCKDSKKPQEILNFEKIDNGTSPISKQEEGGKRGECDNKVQQTTTAGLTRPMHVWTEACHKQYREWFDPRECTFCHDVGDSVQAGRLLPFEDGQWVHVNCLTWSSEVYENSIDHGTLRGAHTARSRSKQLRCSVCGERGATIDCQRKLCRMIFHFPCAIFAGVQFCKNRTAWCNFHATCTPTARQKLIADFPAERLDDKSLKCDIQKHLRIAPFREASTGSALADNPLTGGGSDGDCGGGGGGTKQQTGGSLEASSIASQKQTTPTTSPPGCGIQATVPSCSGSTSLSPLPPPPPADFSLREVQEEKGSGLRVGALTVYSLGELRPHRPGTVSKTHLFPVGFTSMRLFWSMKKCCPPSRSLFVCQVLDSADEWSAHLPPSGHDGVFFRMSESGSSWTVSSTSIDEVYGAVIQALKNFRGPEETIPIREAIGNIFGLNGAQFFGLGLPEVRYALECLPESIESAMDCPESQRYRFCFLQPDASFVRERRRKQAEVAVVTKINPTGAARTEIRTQAVIANLVGRSSRTLLRSADSILEQNATLDDNSVMIRGEKKITGGRRSGGGGSSGSFSVMGDGSSILCGNNNSVTTTSTIGDDETHYSDWDGNTAIAADIAALQALYRSYKMNNNSGGMCIVHRSKIHGWGLFAMKDFDCGDILVEYMGEVIRQCVADRRENKYEYLGVGSCYLFKIENDAIVDATRTGSVARFINHCCDPNAVARVLPSYTGTKKILIIAKKNVKKGDEVTYDYKFAYEEDKLACHCGASNCMGSMN